MLVKLILFDWDGVICDSFGIFHSIHNRLYPEAGMTEQAFKVHFSKRAQAGLPILPGKLADYSEEFCTAALFPGMHQALLRLKSSGKRLALISTSPGGIIRHLLRQQNLLDVFEGLYTSDHALKKPNPQLLDHIQATFKIDEKETLFIGDQVTDLLFVKHTEYIKYLAGYGFCNLAELTETVNQFCISNVSFFNNSSELAAALEQLD